MGLWDSAIHKDMEASSSKCDYFITDYQKYHKTYYYQVNYHKIITSKYTYY